MEVTELNYCYNCMEPLPSGQKVCTVCGHDNSIRENPENVLSEGSILAGKYIVGKVLGQGGFGVTYLGFDLSLEIRVAIKEYFPIGLGSRASNSLTVIPIVSKSNEKGFEKGCDEFQSEAKVLAQFNSLNIVHVRDYFRENGTAYIVMDYITGNSLSKEIHENGKIEWKRVVSLFNPLILELDKLHKKKLIHRDIKPDNIKIAADEDNSEHLVLLDFGVARRFISEKITKTYTALVTPGYAPFEQYTQKSHQGPFTDVYALCATMYAALTGKTPIAAPDRVTGDADLEPLQTFVPDIPDSINDALMHGLNIRSSERTPTMSKLYEELNGMDSTIQNKTRMDSITSGMENPEKNFTNHIATEPDQANSLVNNVGHKESYQKEKYTVQPENKSLEPEHVSLTQMLLADQDYNKIPKAETAKKEISNETSRKKDSGKKIPWAVVIAVVFALLAGIFLIVRNSGNNDGNIKTVIVTDTSDLTLFDHQTETAEVIEQHAVQTVQMQMAQTATQSELYARQTGTAEAIAAQRATQTAEMRVEQTAAQSELYTQQTGTAEAIAAQHAAQTTEMQMVQTATQSELYTQQTGTAEAIAAQQATQTAEMRMEQTAAQLELYAQQTGTVEAIAAQQAAQTAEMQIAQTAAQSELYIRQTGTAESMAVIQATQTKAAEPTATVPVPTNTPTIQPTPAPTSAAQSTLAQLPFDPETLKVGDTVTYGHYEQDNDIVNGSEPIEWLVLSVENNKALLISKYGLDGRAYNNGKDGEKATWEKSELRKWLNNDFYNRAFYRDEKNRISLVTNENPDNNVYNTSGGKDTEDRIFILNIDEARKYFTSDPLRQSMPTRYAITKWPDVYQISKPMWWWLRSPGGWSGTEIAVVKTSGQIDPFGITADKPVGVRPAFWLDMSDEQEVTGYTEMNAYQSHSDNLNTGDIISFGHYEQDNDLQNGAEPIRWQILDITDGKMLIISQYGLDAKQFHEDFSGSGYQESTLRKWLNTDFYENAFQLREKNNIILTNIDNSSGIQTKDKVFLLSHDEVERYFPSDEERKCTATEYATANGVSTNQSSKSVWWWLRTQPKNKFSVEVISNYGWFNEYGIYVNAKYTAVRPALWLSMSAPFKKVAEDTAAESNTNSVNETREIFSVFSSEPKIGELVSFGQYEQDNNVNNGKEPIVWKILSIEENRALLLSAYGLDAKMYNDSDADVTWETSALRSWMNGEFFDSAFTQSEQEQIIQVENLNYVNLLYKTPGGERTMDKVFLLSINEARNYFESAENRQCEGTVFAKHSHLWIDENNGYSWWWLRSPGEEKNFGAIVDSDGNIINSGTQVDNDEGLVRPALWISF